MTIEEICRKMSKYDQKSNLPYLKKCLQEIPLTDKNVAAWCKCFFLIARLSPESPNRIIAFRSVFESKIKKMDLKDPNNAGLIKAIKQRCCDPEIKSLFQRS
jgi:hypothetical protein